MKDMLLNMQALRRYKNILAFSEDNKSYYAFNSNAMQVAEISNETWDSLTPYTLKDSFIPMAFKEDSETEILKELEEWDTEEPDQQTQKTNERIIKSLSINVNQICNLNCTYCYANGDGTFGEPVKNISIEKTLPQLKFFLDRLPEGSQFSIKFVGGEPLLYAEGIVAIFEYVQHYKKIKAINSRFSIVTNGTQFSEKNLNILRHIKAHITVSLDGPPEIHDQFRKTKSGRGSSEVILKGLNQLFKYKNDFSEILFSGVFGKHNMNLQDAYKFYCEYPADYFYFFIEFSESSPEFFSIFQNQFKKVLEMAYKKGGEKELRRISVVDQYFSQLDEQYKVFHHCGAGTVNLSIDANNRILPCPLMVTNKTQQRTADENLIKDLNKHFKENLITQNNCNNCWARFICGGGCMYVNGLESGDFHKKSLNFCERTRFVILEALFYYIKLRKGQNSIEGETHETH